MNIKGMLSKFDVFGVPIQMKFDDNSDNYRSFIGGLTSMILLIVSLIYTIYIFSLRIQGQLEPTANQISYITDFKNIQQDGSLIKVTFQKDDENQIDPFVSQGNILLPVLIKTSYTNDLISQIVLLNDSDTSLSDYESRYIDSQITLSFIHSQKSSKLSVQYEYYLLIVACQDSLLSVGQYCANQSQIDAFFNQQGNSVVFDFQFQTLDPLRLTKSIILDRLYINLEPTVCYLQDSDLKSTNYAINNYYLFGSPNVIELIDDQRIQSQSQTIDYCQNYFFGMTTYIGAYFQFRNLQTQKVISYPTLGQMLAQIGSIISILFFIKYIIIALNERMLLDLILKELTEFYYPEVKFIKVNYTWNKSINKVTMHDRLVDIKQYQNFKEQTHKIMKSKYTYRNIIYELSRMQFVLRSLQSKNLIRQSHNIGIKLNFEHFKQDKNDQFMRRNINQFILTDEDCELFSHHSRQEYHNMFLDDQGPYGFYEMNSLRLNQIPQSISPGSSLMSAQQVQPPSRSSDEVIRFSNLDV